MTEPDSDTVATDGRVDERRRAVLDAAAALLDERAGDGFSMREVAERAGVSAGAVYQWFSGKAEILAVLHNVRFEEELDRVAGLPDLDFEATTADVIRGMATIWSDTGHHRNTMIDAQSAADHNTFLEGMTESFLALSFSVEERLRTAAAREGLELRPTNEMMAWLWAVCIGAGTQLVDTRFIGRAGADSYLAGLAGPTAAGLVQPS